MWPPHKIIASFTAGPDVVLVSSFSSDPTLVM